jgi:hypothetical protein
MTYVPIVTPTPTPPPSPRTRELGGLLAKVVDEYQKAHPAITKAEIQAAFRMAQVARGSNRTEAVLALSVGLGLGALFLGVFFFLGAGDLAVRPILPLIIGIIVVLLAILALVKARLN